MLADISRSGEVQEESMDDNKINRICATTFFFLFYNITHKLYPYVRYSLQEQTPDYFQTFYTANFDVLTWPTFCLFAVKAGQET